MTERTVTIQTEEEQSITLCDECGLSDDAGEILTYKVSQTESMVDVENVRDYGTLHLHRECLDNFGVDVPEQATIASAYEEATDHNASLLLTMNWVHVGTLFVGASILVSAFTTQLGSIGTGEIFQIIIGLAIISFTFFGAYNQANRTIDEIQNND